MVDRPLTTDYLKTATPRSNSPILEELRHEPQDNRLEVHFHQVDTTATDQQQTSASKQTTSADGELVSLGELFSYADSTDKLLMAAGALGGIASGLAQPL